MSYRALSAPVHQLRRPWVGIAVLAILHAVGVVGLVLPLHPDFVYLTPLNLLAGAVLVLWQQPAPVSRRQWLGLGLVFGVGMALEAVGTATGVPFGSYHYGSTLGPQVADVPLAIGLNWAMLVYSTGACSEALGIRHPVGRAAVVATAMTTLDLLLEPVAVRLDFWQWSHTPLNALIVAPLDNYLTWWAAAFVLGWTYHRIAPVQRNQTAVALFITQLLFFAVLVTLLVL